MQTENRRNRPPPRELFFAPLEVSLDPNALEQVQFAYIASKYGHASQTRADGSRYFDHPKAAAWIYVDELNGRDCRTIVDLLLHDLGEDAHLLSPYRLALNFGELVASDVRALTKLPKEKETTEQYIGRVIARGPQAIISKLCDRLHNLRTVGDCSREKQQEQIDETRTKHLPLLIPALHACGQEWTHFADGLECKIEHALSEIEAHLSNIA